MSPPTTSGDPNVTPIRKQYLQIKSQHPDAILFFRLGDFYETFDEDAEITSRELDIVLTSRNVAKNQRIPMAGIPYHAVENYLARLIEKGYHVAICDQIGSQPVKGLVPRKVVRVVTPGTVVEPGLLNSGQNNYLAAIVLQSSDTNGGPSRAGIAYVDITTGEFAASELSSKDIGMLLRGEIARLKPAEVLFSESLPDRLVDTLTPPESSRIHPTRWPAWRFEMGRCEQALLQHFEVAALDGFGLRGMALAVQAAGSVLQYLKETQPEALNLLGGLNTYNLNEFMTLDAATQRNLELTETIRHGETRGSLLSILDHTVTAMGKRLIRQWVSKPLLELTAIESRLDGVGYLLVNGLLRAELRAALKSLADLERLTNRTVTGHAGPRDLAAVRITLEQLPDIQAHFLEEKTPFELRFSGFALCSQELALLKQAIQNEPPATLQHTGVICPGFSDELDNVVESSRHAREWIANLEDVERKRTGIKTLKVGYNKVFGYYIEITRSNTAMAPDDYIRKQTLVNAERYITPEMKEYETLVLNAEERIRAIETRLFKDVCSQLSGSALTLLETARCLAELDVLTSLAETAALNGYTRPVISADTTLEINDGRHPVVEHTLSTQRFVPNDAVFETGELVRIITGPNMSGKSTFLRQTALIALMAQMGSYVPASEARIGLVDRIFTRIGAQDEIHAGQSTFMVEMVETANILNHATHRSLLILDEIGRGTSTYDGVSIAWAMVEYIHNHPGLQARTLFATHFHELTQLSDILPGVRNFNVAVSEAEGQPVFLHKIVPGGADRSYGIHVGQLAGLPRPVTQRAAEILQQLETSAGKTVKLDGDVPQQMAFFPETNPLVDDLKSLDINTLSPIEALNMLYAWKRKYTD